MTQYPGEKYGKHKTSLKRVQSIINKSYKDMGGKGITPRARTTTQLPSYAGGMYNPATNKILFHGTKDKKDIDIDKHMKNFDTRFKDKTIKDTLKGLGRRVKVAMNTNTSRMGTPKTRLHHIYHETGHAVDSSTGIQKIFNAHRFVAPLVGVPVGIKKASNKEDKHGVAKGAAIAGASTSGTFVQEISPEVRMYKMLRKKGIARKKVLSFMAPNMAENLGVRAIKPLLVAGGVSAIGKYYKNRPKKIGQRK